MFFLCSSCQEDSGECAPLETGGKQKGEDLEVKECRMHQEKRERESQGESCTTGLESGCPDGDRGTEPLKTGDRLPGLLKHVEGGPAALSGSHR